MQAVLQSATDFAGGLQDVTGEWMRSAQRQVERNLDQMEQLGQCRTFHDFLALQTQMIRENMETLLQSVQHIGKIYSNCR
jgi:hypothetical protein